MPDRHIVEISWAPRRETVDGYAALIHRFLTELGKPHRAMRSWRFGADREAIDAGACRDALVAGEETWAIGEEEQKAYEARFYVGRQVASPVEVTVTCGIEPLPLGALFAPNRLRLAIRHDAPDEITTTDVVVGALTHAVATFGAAFGHAGSDRVPRTAMALYSPGVPPVGWVTYFSKAYPSLPAKLPSPAVAHVVAGGSLVVAHPKPFREHKRNQREAIDAVRKALDEAGVLVRWAEVAARQP